MHSSLQLCRAALTRKHGTLLYLVSKVVFIKVLGNVRALATTGRIFSDQVYASIYIKDNLKYKNSNLVILKYSTNRRTNWYNINKKTALIIADKLF